MVLFSYLFTRKPLVALDLWMALVVTGPAPCHGKRHAQNWRKRPGRRVVATGGKGKGKSSKSSGRYCEFDEGTRDNIFDHSKLQISTETSFISFCQSRLLSPGVASDGLISQKDVAEMAADICGIFEHESIPKFACPSPEFSDLALEIQLSFIWYICPPIPYPTELLACLEDLSAGGDFGYPVRENRDACRYESEDVLGFCCSLLPYLDEYGLVPFSVSICPGNLPDIESATPEPTPISTRLPVAPPTPQPITSTIPAVPETTSQPSEDATGVPTGPPTSKPTITLLPMPTLEPMPGPTATPMPESPISRGDSPVASAVGPSEAQSIDSDPRISAGGIVGIVLGSVFVLALAAGLSYRRRKADELG